MKEPKMKSRNSFQLSAVSLQLLKNRFQLSAIGFRPLWNTFWVVLAFAFSSQLWAEGLQKPEVETLPNGLKVVWFLNDKLPMVDLSLLVKAGFRDDPAGKSGVAELTANLLDRGAAGMSAQQLGRAIEMLGGVRYVIPEDDSFSIGLHGLAPDANSFLDLLAKMVLKPEFAEAELQRERGRLKDRWQHVGDYSEALITLAYNRLQTAGTSYGRGNMSSVKELESVTRNDLVQFHQTYFAPQNSILMVVGRVDKLAFKQKVAEVFGAWPSSAAAETQPARKSYSDARLISGRPTEGVPTLLIIDRPDLTQAQLKIGFRAPLILAPEHDALTVLNALVGESFSSRLNTQIRDKLGLTYSITSAFSYRKDLADFTVSSSTRNEMVGQLIHKIEEVLKDIKKGPILQEEVDQAKEYLKGGFPLNNADLNAVASHWLASTFYGLGPDYLNEFGKRIDAVTLKDVQEAAAKDIDLSHLVIVVAGEAKAVKVSLKESKFKSFKLVSATDLK